ncbi:TPA: fimbrial protein [Raoultella planticola]|uniref:fimbrial protein n=1 Tax=Raoultella planticola TaxID=575 RepID=UPI00177C98DA|nr:fimbrial protein [Raoultella planticola]MBE0014943.1 type 1 fimbrial protein [Raoultella planticola]
MPGWRTLLLLILLPSTWTLASTSKLAKTPGKMHLQGEIIEAACYVDHDDQELLVEFHNISARDISNAPENISAHDFSIHLLGCSLGDSQHPGSIFHSASITFYNASQSNDKDDLSVKSDSGDLSITIFDKYGNPIHMGIPSPDYVLNPGKNTLRFTAHLVSPNGYIRSGEFNASMHFVVNYL